MTASALSVSPDLLRPAPSAPTSPASGAVDDAKRARIAKVARDFEAQFTSVMLGEMFEGTEASAPFGGGEGEGMFRSFMTDAMAKSMTRHGGIGLAAAIQKEMLKMQGASSAPPATTAAGPSAAAASAAYARAVH